jgi:ABC-type Fe3+-siderophore transport system permease subunit
VNRKTVSLSLVCLAIVGVAPFLGERPAEGFVLWQLRIPRVMMAFAVGATLGLAGAVDQTIFSNPLATPSTVGTTAGAALGALAGAVLVGGGGFAGLPWVVLLAFLGALTVTGLIAAIAYSGRARVNDVLLAGIAISLAASAISSGLHFSADMMSTFQVMRWSLGNLAQVGYQRVLLLLPFVLVSTGMMFWQLRSLEAMVAGQDRAHSQGVDVRRVRAITLGAGALGLGACVALCGPIAFVGLIVPHAVRLTFGGSRRVLMPLSWLTGGVFLVACDLLARSILGGREIPVGVITSAIGAPVIVWLVARSGRSTLR